MTEAAVGIAYGLETLIEGAVALAKGIYHPTLPLKARLTAIGGVDVPRAYHTMSIVNGRAYIFGGKSGDALADNAMHVIILPSSGVEGLDYKKIERSSDAPPPRSKHSAAVIDSRIYIFGGLGDDDAALVENGRVWVFDTITNGWSHLDADPNALKPQPRAKHASIASEDPRPPARRTDQDTLPQAPPDPASIVPEPPAPDTYGTIFVQGGSGQAGVSFNDMWAFDVSSRTWSELPAPPPPSSGSPSLAIMDHRLYTFALGQVSYLDLTSGNLIGSAGSGQLGLTPRGPWSSLRPTASGPDNPYPGERSGSYLIPLTTGQGRHYLALVGGTAFDGKTLDDIWVLQLKPENLTAASVKDAARHALKKETEEAHWAEVKYHNSDGVLIQENQPGRGVGMRLGLVAAKGTEVDGASLILWGGIDEHGQSRSDGFMITVDR